jgi:hypothetical protein
MNAPILAANISQNSLMWQKVTWLVGAVWAGAIATA